LQELPTLKSAGCHDASLLEELLLSRVHSRVVQQFSFSSDDSCKFTNPASLNTTDPVLGPLGNYGGRTMTLPLLAGSPAIDHDNDALSPAADPDLRESVNQTG
jgi:hypothetical protein